MQDALGLLRHLLAEARTQSLHCFMLLSQVLCLLAVDKAEGGHARILLALHVRFPKLGQVALDLFTG